MEKFDNSDGLDEDRFTAWQNANPMGFVVNTPRHFKSEYYKIHRATCGSLRSNNPAHGSVPFTGSSYIKLCSLHVIELVIEAERHKPNYQPSFCKSCKPEPFASNNFAESSLTGEMLQGVARLVPLSNLRDIARSRGDSHPKRRDVKSSVIERDPCIAAFAKRAADGVCSLCGLVVDLDPVDFLDSHHIIFLRNRGADEIENVIGVCPNCHRRLHIAPEAQVVTNLLHLATERANGGYSKS